MSATSVIVRVEDAFDVAVDPAEPDFSQVLMHHRCWEPHITAAIRKHFPKGGVFLDIGANVGVMSFTAVACGASKVIAFEPNPANVNQFRRGIVANGYTNVLLYPFAVSDEFRMLATSRVSNAKVAPEVSALTADDVVQAVPLDEMLKGEPRVDFLKIDIEGYEPAAFAGMDTFLRRTRPLVLMEFNPLCLRSQGGIDPAIMADRVFNFATDVKIVEHDGSYTSVASAAELMDLWRERDRLLTDAGTLPAGWVHFDLLFRAYGATRPADAQPGGLSKLIQRILS